MPETPNINDIKLIKLNREKVENAIIKPKDDKIMELYQENLKLHNELSKQANLVKVAEKYQKERDKILADVENIKTEYKEKEFDLEWDYKKQVKKLEKENNRLHKIVDKFYETVDKFIVWICHKFGIGESKELVRKFEEETRTFIDPIKQIEHEEREKEWDLER